LISRTALVGLLTAAVVLPIAISIVWAVGRLLLAMQDAAAATVLDRVALALGLAWLLDLVCLLLAVALRELGPPDERS